jgi:hypothetical protein
MDRLASSDVGKRFLNVGLIKFLLVCFFLGGRLPRKIDTCSRGKSALPTPTWTRAKSRWLKQKTFAAKLAVLDAQRQRLRKNQAEGGAPVGSHRIRTGGVSEQLEEAAAMHGRNGEGIREIRQPVKSPWKLM